MRLVSKDDFIDVYLKLSQRGLPFILSKLNPIARSRTKSAFDTSSAQSSNWWTIPMVKQRWNEKITGDILLGYEKYVVDKYLSNKSDLRILSIGSGVCSHELKFAKFPNVSKIICVDIADNLIAEAARLAEEQNLTNINFLVNDIYELSFKVQEFDMIMFHASLHHLSNIHVLISSKIKKWLKSNGILLINEYVGPNRLQFKNDQIQSINIALHKIPKRLRKRFQSKLIKNKFYGSGIIRMIVADPSECIESANILPVLRKEFEIIEEKALGGNLLMNILKDISHNFIKTQDKEVEKTLNILFAIEDEYLKEHESDFYFGLYKKVSSDSGGV